MFLTGYGFTRSYNAKCRNENFSLVRFVFDKYVNLEINYLFIYIFAFIVALLSVGNHPLDIYNQTALPLYNFVVDIFGMANGFGTPTLNGTWWYMTLAILLIFFLPLVVSAVKRFNILIPLLFFFLPMFGITNEYLVCYFPAAVLGVWCAEYDIFSKISEIGHKYIRVAIVVGLIIVFCKARIEFGWMGITNTVIAFLIILLLFLLTKPTKKNIIYRLLLWVGENSLSIFLTHTFVTVYYASGFIYRFKYSILIFIVTLMVSVVIAFLIDILKKVTGFSRLVKYIRLKIMLE